MSNQIPSSLPVVPSIADYPEIYDYLVLGAMRSPGVVKLSGDALKVKITKAEPKGVDGGTSTINGRAIRGFKASFFIWDDVYSGVNHYIAWAPFYAFLFAQSAAPKGLGLPIQHPDLSRADITSVCVESISLPKYDGKGGMTVDVDFTDSKPPKPNLAGSVTAVAADQGPIFDPNADLKRKLEERWAAFNAMGNDPPPGGP